jgi:hypothetical protein
MSRGQASRKREQDEKERASEGQKRVCVAHDLVLVARNHSEWSTDSARVKIKGRLESNAYDVRE